MPWFTKLCNIFVPITEDELCKQTVCKLVGHSLLNRQAILCSLCGVNIIHLFYSSEILGCSNKHKNFALYVWWSAQFLKNPAPSDFSYKSCFNLYFDAYEHNRPKNWWE